MKTYVQESLDLVFVIILIIFFCSIHTLDLLRKEPCGTLSI